MAVRRPVWQELRIYWEWCAMKLHLGKVCVPQRAAVWFHCDFNGPPLDAFKQRNRISMFLLKIFFFLSFLFVTLQYCIGFAIHQHESATGVHVFPSPEPSSHLPPHTISLGHPNAPAPSILYPASNLDWRFVSYLIVYMFQCHSPKSSHPCPLPQSPKDCSINLCLFCCFTYRVIVSIFLNSIYMR